MFRRAAALSICLLVGNTLAWATDEPPALIGAKPIKPMEEPLQGDFWIYEVRDEISGKINAVRKNVVTEVTSTDISVLHTVEGKDTQGLSIYDRSWNLKENAPWKYQPHDGSGIRAPLKVGATWSFSGDDVAASKGAIWKRSGNAKVVGQETITTKAGTFETYKIETTMSRRPTTTQRAKWKPRE